MTKAQQEKLQFDLAALTKVVKTSNLAQDQVDRFCSALRVADRIVAEHKTETLIEKIKRRLEQFRETAAENPKFVYVTQKTLDELEREAGATVKPRNFEPYIFGARLVPITDNEIVISSWAESVTRYSLDAPELWK